MRKSAIGFPGSGGGTQTSQDTMTERIKVLQSYLADLVMIPAIKESNQLKAFLGVKEHYPEFYNNDLEEVKNGNKPLFAINLKDFTVPKKEGKGDLMKFLTKQNDISEQVESPRKMAPASTTTKSRTNLRYQVSHENLDGDFSPDKEQQQTRKQDFVTEKKAVP